MVYGALPLLGYSRNPNLSIIKGDIRDRDALGKAMKDHDWILHLAAIVGYPACAADPQLCISTNVEGTRNVIELMGKGQRLIFASTGSTYGKVEGVATEETPIAPLTLYGKSKRDGEMLVCDSNREFTILRFATVFGSSPRMRIDLLINDFVYQAPMCHQIVLFEGYFRRTFLHSSDAAAVYPFAMEKFDQMRRKYLQRRRSGDELHQTRCSLKIKEYVDYYLHEAQVGTDPDRATMQSTTAVCSHSGSGQRSIWMKACSSS